MLICFDLVSYIGVVIVFKEFMVEENYVVGDKLLLECELIICFGMMWIIF